jgi:Zn finger protein HypA/HybF involved in hydrogenase expression
MGNMGIRNKNGQIISVFTCLQCHSMQLTDFRYYPICNKCNKTNLKIAKRNKSGHSSEEKED